MEYFTTIRKTAASVLFAAALGSCAAATPFEPAPWGRAVSKVWNKFSYEVDPRDVLLSAICNVYIDHRRCWLNAKEEWELDLFPPHQEVGDAVLQTLRGIDANGDGLISYLELEAQHKRNYEKIKARR